MELEIIKLRNNLSQEEKNTFKIIYHKRKKRVGLAYLFLLITGVFGGHRFYIHKYLSGALMIALFIISIMTHFGVGFILWGGWYLFDLLSLAGQVDKYNTKLEYDLLREILNMGDVVQKTEIPQKQMQTATPVLGELSLNNNRLFSLKGSIKSNEVRNYIDKLYDVLKQMIVLIKQESMEPKEIERIATYYLPELIDILERFIQIESTTRGEETIQKTVNTIKDTIDKIIKNLTNAVEEINRERQLNIELDLEVLRKSMSIEGFENKF